jgi:hypothetical protein
MKALLLAEVGQAKPPCFTSTSSGVSDAGRLIVWPETVVNEGSIGENGEAWEVERQN